MTSTTTPQGQSDLVCRWRRCSRAGPYASAKALFEHLSSVHVPYNGANTLTCDWNGCRRTSTIGSTNERADHYRAHAKYKPFVCASDGAGFATEYNLRRHVAKHRVSDTPAAPQELKCCWTGCTHACPNDADGAAQLAAHLAGAHRTLPCRWEACTRNPKGNIEGHLRTHLPSWYKPHKCERCGKAFSAPRFLKRHNTNERLRDAAAGSAAPPIKRAKLSLIESEDEGTLDESSVDVPLSSLPFHKLHEERVSESPEVPESAEESLLKTNAALHERVCVLEKVICELQNNIMNPGLNLALHMTNQIKEAAGPADASSDSERESIDEGEDWSLCM